MKKSNRHISIQAAVAALAATLVSVPATAADYRQLTTECEIAVARSAVPLRLRADASVFALRGDKYEKVVAGTGPLTCIVERNHRDAIVPQCMDQAGIDSVLPAIIHRSLMSVAGATFEEIEADFKRRADAGEFRPAARSGISYMLSDYNYTYVGPAQRVLKIAPHVMFYAPYLANGDIGGSFESLVKNVGTPFVFNEGIHGYMIVYAEHHADPNEVADVCREQLAPAPPSFNPFPQG